MNAAGKSAPRWLFEGLRAKDYVTLASTALGAISVGLSLQGLLVPAATAIVLAVVADYLDGKVARESFGGADEFGKQLDSLSDAVSFGLAPVALALSAAGGALLLAAGIVYACCGVVRLARFNLQEEKGVYNGLPIPAAALLSAASALATPAWLWLELLVLAALMVAPFKLKKA